MNNHYYVYITTNKYNKVLYTGVTNNLLRRIWEHKNRIGNFSFTKKYNVDKLVYYEVYYSINDAIAREKQIKAGNRKNKINLINNFNAEWRDLYEEMAQ